VVSKAVQQCLTRNVFEKSDRGGAPFRLLPTSVAWPSLDRGIAFDAILGDDLAGQHTVGHDELSDRQTDWRCSMSAISISFGIALYALIALAAVPAHAAVNPAALFAKKCTSCHTYGQGDKVGPDLKGVTTRRSLTWLTAWIRSSERLIKSGDPMAAALFQKYKGERMPDQNFTAEELDALLGYIAAAGPETIDGPRSRHATTATPAEVARGRDLFTGTVSARSGGAACASCHKVGEYGAVRRATLAGDLTRIYSRFQDFGLTAFLKHPCFPRVVRKDGEPVLSEDEAFSIKAFLWQMDRDAASGPR
jgi:mono/diheme cytochrome c family protein